jgi:DNA-binding NarL/FixJ family response regulator
LGDRARVAVLDPLPLFQRGVVDVLTSDDVLAEAPVDIQRWVAQGGQQVTVLTLASPADWSLLEELSAETPVIAVLEENTDALAIKALRLGAESVVARSATASVIRRAVEAVLAGEVILSRSVTRSLISSFPRERHRPDLTEEQVQWLRELASGVTIAQLANQAGYSERAMYRLLNNLYERLGVTNRTEALIKANSYGWLDPDR